MINSSMILVFLEMYRIYIKAMRVLDCSRVEHIVLT